MICQRIGSGKIHNEKERPSVVLIILSIDKITRSNKAEEGGAMAS